MKRWIAFVVLLVVLAASGACQPAAAPPAVEEAPAQPAAEEVTLTIVSPTGSKTLTLDELKQLPAAKGQAGIKSSTGKITPPALFKGVLLTDLIDLVGGLSPELGVQVEAKDGYAITFSADQITNGELITYDPVTGDETQSAGKLQVLIAYEIDGEPLDVERDGSLRVVIISEGNNQVTDGHWSVKWVRTITVKPVAAEWTLWLEGAIQEEMDRATFESGAAEKCHLTVWKDEKAQDWVGIPLWLMVGWVDDENKHEDKAFNDDLADAGYVVEVIAQDGYSATFDSARVKRNDNLIVAYLVNGNPLPDKDFPLRLVGSDVQKKEGVGQIAKIIVHLDQKPEAAAPLAESAPTEAPAAAQQTSVDAGDAALAVDGLVNSPQAWLLDDLKKLEVVKVTVEHPKKGQMDVEGLRINDLLELAGINPEAGSVVITAADGYTAEVELSALEPCADCLVTLETDGSLRTAMPGMESGVWVKDVVRLEVK